MRTPFLIIGAIVGLSAERTLAFQTGHANVNKLAANSAQWRRSSTTLDSPFHYHSSHQQTASTGTALEMSSVGMFVEKVSAPLIKRSVMLIAAALVAIFRNRILWPGSAPDKSLSEPVPRGEMGCPFMGLNLFGGTEDYGPGASIGALGKKLGRPSLFKFYSFGMPMVAVRGKDKIQKAIYKREFGRGVTSFDYNKMPNLMEVFGARSVLYESNKDKHSMLRRLIGVAMNPKALEQAVDPIQKASQSQVEKIVASLGSEVAMDEICNDLTLDIAWRQILGLDLSTEEEIEEFHKATKEWVEVISADLSLLMPFRLPWLKRNRGYKARQYLVDQVEKKIAQLDRDGPDGSTLSEIYFATDEDGTTKLSHQEVLDNSLILILAGSETSASTLTNVMLLLGLHKDKLKKLQQEQREYIAKHGTTLVKDEIDADMTYLDAFLRETLRIRPLPTTEVRVAETSMVMDGQQIPKKWAVLASIRATHEMDPACRKNDNDDHMDLMKGFSPERWLSSSTKPREWMPFGEGAHRCAGERLSMLEMKIFVATLVRKIKDFDLVNVEDTSNLKLKKTAIMPVPADGAVIRPTAIFESSSMGAAVEA